MVRAIRPAVENLGHQWSVIDWEAPIEHFTGIDLVVLGTCWNYQDKEEAFLAKLEALQNAGVAVCNSPDVVRWNICKTYLQELEKTGASTVPTLWLDTASTDDVQNAFAQFECDTIVAKRQIGAGAEGQSILHLGSVPHDWRMDRPAMLQPFLPAIQAEGEFSFIFIDGEFSHALIKRAAQADYRIQSLYGGTEEMIMPAPGDLVSAASIISNLPFAPPLYARIDMVRRDNKLLLMEAEMIEPYLYPVEGPDLGARMAKAIDRRLNIHE
jgi:hypothetical protein